MELQNEKYDFGKARKEVIESFRNKAAEKKRFPEGTALYRVYSFARKDREPGHSWFSEEVFLQLSTLSQRVGVSLADCVRARLAVAIDWTPDLDRLCRGILTSDIFGFTGLAAYQQLVSDKGEEKGLTHTPKILLMGNFSQIWFSAIGKHDIEITPMAELKGKMRA